VCFTDISEIVLLPAIAQRVLATAPNVRLEITHITETIPKSLESGAADVAVGFMPQLEAGFRQQRLFRQEFVCLASEQHPRIKGALTLKQFTAEAHLAVTTSGTGHWIVERTLEESCIERRVVLRVPSFLGLAAVIGATQLLAIVPRRLGETLLPQGKIKILDLPVKIPSYVVKQHWHERYHRDPGNVWLRQAIREIFAE
jgi:DNA-binding transcriptional LysR family regulator